MKAVLSKAIWRLLDPLLIKMESRRTHLASLRPANRAGDQFVLDARFDSTVVFGEWAKATSFGGSHSIAIGSFSNIQGELLAARDTARLVIGHHNFIGPGSRIWAYKKIQIGNYVLISHLVDVHDCDSHSTDAADRRQHAIDLFERRQPADYSTVPAAPVVIEDDVWIGFKSTILKGVTIGRGAIVAAGSVVTKSVPPYTIVAGNPARTVRQIFNG